jgi:hypothetical protein
VRLSILLAISTEKATSDRLGARTQRFALGGVILDDIYRNFKQAKLQYRQPIYRFPINCFGYTADIALQRTPFVDDKFVRFPGTDPKSSKSTSIEDRLTRKSSKSHRVREKPFIHRHELFFQRHVS